MAEYDFEFEIGDYVKIDPEKDIRITKFYINGPPSRRDMNHLKGRIFKVFDRRCLDCLGINQYLLDKHHEWFCEDTLVRAKI